MLHASLTTLAELLSSVNAMGSIICEMGFVSRVLLSPVLPPCPPNAKSVEFGECVLSISVLCPLF